MAAAERESAWAAALARPVFAGLAAEEVRALRDRAERLLTEKDWTPVRDAAPEADDLAVIALMAALPALYLDDAIYRGWREVVLYPDDFLHAVEEVDEAGVVHCYHDARSGEAWSGGPLILSLSAVRESGWREGFNVVLHEFAHKLDMTTGEANGLPELHAGMSARAWAGAFSAAYADMTRRVDEAGDDARALDALRIDPYAAHSPGEFFAVLTEYFFELPEAVMETWPAVYEQLRQYYRQDPLIRFRSLS